jgi:hypothetical protein
MYRCNHVRGHGRDFCHQNVTMTKETASTTTERHRGAFCLEGLLQNVESEDHAGKSKIMHMIKSAQTTSDKKLKLENLVHPFQHARRKRSLERRLGHVFLPILYLRLHPHLHATTHPDFVLLPGYVPPAPKVPRMGSRPAVVVLLMLVLERQDFEDPLGPRHAKLVIDRRQRVEELPRFLAPVHLRGQRSARSPVQSPGFCIPLRKAEAGVA